MIRTENGYIFRRYLISICWGDYGLHDQIYLERREWRIYQSGKIEYNFSDNFTRVLDLPSQRLSDVYPDFGA